LTLTCKLRHATFTTCDRCCWLDTHMQIETCHVHTNCALLSSARPFLSLDPIPSALVVAHTTQTLPFCRRKGVASRRSWRSRSHTLPSSMRCSSLQRFPTNMKYVWLTWPVVCARRSRARSSFHSSTVPVARSLTRSTTETGCTWPAVARSSACRSLFHSDILKSATVGCTWRL
jgi:hypothetical protein